jgi:biotin synthase
MGAAWRRVPDSALPKLVEMVQEVKVLGLETCVTLGII